MPKLLPPSTLQGLSPPANDSFPYTFFEGAPQLPLQALDAQLNLRTAWWLADAAFLAYSNEAAVRQALEKAGIQADVRPFGGLSTQCYVITTAEWILLAFRGTQVDRFWDLVRDWAVNVQFLPVPALNGRVHQGFLSALNEVWDSVRSYVRSEQQAKPRPFWMTGHSLGGALAVVAAGRCATETDLGLTGVYTFGSPRVGDRAFVDSIRAPIFRFRYDVDIVPHLPFGLVFTHAGTLQFINSTGNLENTGGMSEWLFDLKVAASSGWRTALEGGQALLALPPSLADHAPINYAILIWNILDRTG